MVFPLTTPDHMSLMIHSTRLFPKFLGAEACQTTGIAARCDWVVLSDTRPPHTCLKKNHQTDTPRHIFLSLRQPFAAIRYFATRILPTLRSGFVLVSGSEDCTIPTQLDTRWREYDGAEQEYISAILSSPNLIHWFAENLSESGHPRLSPLPTGMVFPEGNAENMVPPPDIPPLGRRPLRILCAHRVRPDPQWDLRKSVTKLARTDWKPWCTVLEDDISEPQYLKLLEQHAFVLCVEGGGLDPSPKAWQAILHGAIPIIRKTALEPAYRELPVGFIADWTAPSLTRAMLREWHGQFGKAHDDPAERKRILHSLSMDFWWGKIQAKILPAKTLQAQPLKNSDLAPRSDGQAKRVITARPLEKIPGDMETKVKTKPRAIIILGNHRSGTSALARVVNLLGADLPGNLMPETPDNSKGYWESRDLAAINDGLLNAAGTRWHDDAEIPDSWFESDAVARFHEPAMRFLNRYFQGSACFVLKDPRLCRLVPFWQERLEAFGADPHFLLTFRHPQEVFQSLLARLENGYQSVRDVEKSDLLWIRHCLEAERQTRAAPRTIVTYSGLLGNWREMLQPLVSLIGSPLEISRETAASIDGFLSPQHRSHNVDRAPPRENYRLATDLYEMLWAAVRGDKDPDFNLLKAASAALNEVSTGFDSLRAANRNDIASDARLHGDVLVHVENRTCVINRPDFCVLYISPDAQTPMHRYRVTHKINALQQAGVTARWVGLGNDIEAAVDQADVVVILRSMWNKKLAAVKSRCRVRGIPFLLDIDDLIFDADVLTLENFPHLPQWSKRNNLKAYLRTVTEADQVIVPTEPLARAVRKFATPAHVLPNGLEREMIEQADRALNDPTAKPFVTDGRVRVGYASGSMTHQNDFAAIVPTLITLFNEQPDWVLSVVGHLDLQAFPELQAFGERIEIRPIVPHDQLLQEYARFDVNLAPLECGNPFCEAKSPLKYLQAGCVRVPTVAAATIPYQEAVLQGVTGFIASDPAQWHQYLTDLIGNRDLREKMGKNAQAHVRAAFGPRANSAAAVRLFSSILGQGRARAVAVFDGLLTH